MAIRGAAPRSTTKLSLSLPITVRATPVADSGPPSTPAGSLSPPRSRDSNPSSLASSSSPSLLDLLLPGFHLCPWSSPFPTSSSASSSLLQFHQIPNPQHLQSRCRSPELRNHSAASGFNEGDIPAATVDLAKPRRTHPPSADVDDPPPPVSPASALSRCAPNPSFFFFFFFPPPSFISRSPAPLCCLRPERSRLCLRFPEAEPLSVSLLSLCFSPPSVCSLSSRE